MLNIETLEKLWLKYRIKKNFPYVLALLTVLLIAILVSYNYFSTPIQIAKNKTTNEVNNTHEVTTKPIVSDKQVAKNSSHENKTILKPSMSFVNRQDSSNNIPLYIPKPYTEKVKEPKKYKVESSEDSSSSSMPMQEISKHTAPVNVPKKKSENDLHITVKNTENDLQSVINRFKKNKNPKLSLYIAKKYYSLKNYNKSYNYALITNQIDSNIEESWIIFAKSLYKLGETKMAMKTLTSYINNSESIKASLLLNDMKEGKIK